MVPLVDLGQQAEQVCQCQWHWIVCCGGQLESPGKGDCRARLLIPKTNTGLRRESEHRTRKMGMGARVWSWAKDWLGTAWKTPNLPGCRARKRSAGVSHPAPSLEIGDSLKWPESGWVLNTEAGCRAISTCHPKLRRRLDIDLLFTWGGTSPPHTPPAGHKNRKRGSGEGLGS